MGVSLNRVEGTGLGVARGLEKGEGKKGGGGVWLREVELLRLVFRFSRGVVVVVVVEGRSAEEAVVAEEGGRGEDADVRLSGMGGALEQAEPGLLGAGFRFGLGRVPVVVVVGDAMQA